MNKPIITTLLAAILSIAPATILGQENAASQPKTTIKTNLLYLLTTTLNAEVETRLSRQLTLDLALSYNPWTFSENRKLKHILIQPEVRYWAETPFAGHFMGAHLLYAHYNVGNLPLGALRNNRFQGDAYGIGLSYGHQWHLAPRWNIEATLGAGYIFFDYARYQCTTCGNPLGRDTKRYMGPTKLGIGVSYEL